VSIAFIREGRAIAGNLARWLVIALAMAPVVAALDLATRGPLEGWSGSRIDQWVGWTLLSAPYLLILGAPATLGYLIILRVIRPRRLGAIRLAVFVAGGCYGALMAWPHHLALDDWTLRAAITSTPLWLVLGGCVRLPERSGPGGAGAWGAR
jgi:hypothetical protein